MMCSIFISFFPQLHFTMFSEYYGILRNTTEYYFRIRKTLLRMCVLMYDWIMYYSSTIGDQHNLKVKEYLKVGPSTSMLKCNVRNIFDRVRHLSLYNAHLPKIPFYCSSNSKVYEGQRRILREEYIARSHVSEKKMSSPRKVCTFDNDVQYFPQPC